MLQMLHNQSTAVLVTVLVCSVAILALPLAVLARWLPSVGSVGSPVAVLAPQGDQFTAVASPLTSPTSCSTAARKSSN